MNRINRIIRMNRTSTSIGDLFQAGLCVAAAALCAAPFLALL